MTERTTTRRRNVRAGQGKARGQRHPYLPLLLPGIADVHWEKYAAQERGRRRSGLAWLIAEWTARVAGQGVKWTAAIGVVVVPNAVRRAVRPSAGRWTTVGLWTATVAGEVLIVWTIGRTVL